MKKLLATILSMVLILSAVPTLAVSAENGDTDKLDTLAELVAAIGAAETSEDKVVTLEGNIDMTDATYPIATLTNGVVINGNGYSLTNLTMTVDNSEVDTVNAPETAKDLSIFALAENASVTVKNLTIGSEENKVAFENTPSADPWLDNGTGEFYAVLVSEVLEGMSLNVDNVDIYADMTTKVNGGSVVGGFVAVVEGSASFFGCSMNGSVTSEASESIYGRAGGFVGAATGFSSVTLKNCVNNADVKGEVNAGGFIGASRSHNVTIENCTNNGNIGHIGAVPAIGGIIGNIAINEIASDSHFDTVAPATEIKYTIANCVNNGAITSTDAKAYTGGVIGWVNHASAATGVMNILGCVNNGEISSASKSSINSKSAVQYGTGGIVGQLKHAWNTTIDSCVNNGAVTNPNNEFLGGIVGVYFAKDGYINEIRNCVNTAAITAPLSNWPAVGGMVGIMSSASKKSNSTYNVDGILNIYTSFNTGALVADETETSYGSEGNLIGTGVAGVKEAYTVDKISGYYGTAGYDATADGKKYESLEALAAAVNDVCKAGRFIFVDGAVENTYILEFVPAPVVVGAQVSAVKTVGGKKVVDVRFLAVLKDADLEKYSRVGFKIDAVDTDGTEGGTDKSGTSVYTSILATTDAGAGEYTNADLNGKYIIAITVGNVPAEAADTVELTATAYVTGDVAGTATDIFSANSTTIKLTAGKYVAS